MRPTRSITEPYNARLHQPVARHATFPHQGPEYPNNLVASDFRVPNLNEPERQYIDTSHIKTPPLTFSFRTEPGVYEITQASRQTKVESDGGKLVIRHQYDKSNDERRSQWEFAPLGKGWTIRSMYSGLYLTVGQGTKNGVPIVSHEFPLAWDVQDANKNTPEVKIFWPNSKSFWSPTDGLGNVGMSIQLGGTYTKPDPRSMLWQLKFVRTLPSTHQGVYPKTPRPRNKRLPQARGGSDLDSDTDGSDTISKTITRKTKKKISSRQYHRYLSGGDLPSGSDSDGSETISDIITKKKKRHSSQRNDRYLSGGDSNSGSDMDGSYTVSESTARKKLSRHKRYLSPSSSD